jgi:hypothetical protein
VLFEGRQFAYRDAGHFFYPLYRVVQEEWEAGRWPLWNPWQNGGTPLLGMPMAAVLYPGKLLFAVLPYALAFRLYVVAHTIIAWLGMLFLARGLGLSSTAAFLAAISYAFGAPVLFLYSNVIFLVGAAWAPWGFLAVHRLLSERKRQAVIELACVLVLQILGGDPEAAYLILIFGSIYAGVLFLEGRERSYRLPTFRRVLVLGVPGAMCLWFTLVCGVAYLAPLGVIPDWLLRSHVIWPSVLAVVSLIALWKVRARAPRVRTRPMLAGLAAAGLLAVALAAVQLGPTCEFALQSWRMTSPSAAGLYDFSLEPYRVIEAIWPHISGLEVPVNRSWIQALPPAGERMIWTPSLYLGAFTLVLFLGTARLRLDQPWRLWLTTVAILSALAGMGKFAGPLWWVRWVPQLAALVGEHDPPAGISRGDLFLADGAGSIYGLLATALPGFALFRYPAKLLVFTCLAISGLAGLGWDRLVDGNPRSLKRLCGYGAITSGAALVVGAILRDPIEGLMRRRVPPSPLFGTVDPTGALNSITNALVQGGMLYAVGWILAPWASRRPRVAGVFALVTLTADLALADCRIVWTVPQSALDTTPLVARLIDRSEHSRPSAGPFRIHRVEQWHPAVFRRHRSEQRLEEVVAWEHDTLDRLYGEAVPLDYTFIHGIIDLDEYLEFFASQAILRDDQQGTTRPIFSFPRGAFDLWNTRYFIMPVELNGWMGNERGFTRVYPEENIVADPELSDRWIARQGWQLLRNQRALPRSWIVHDAVVVPLADVASHHRADIIQTLIGSSEVSRNDPEGRRRVDLSQTAFVETNEPAQLAQFLKHPKTGSAESLAIIKAEPQSVELQVTMNRPGLVVLADLYYPGWHLAIDGTPAPILRTNRMMRGAAVPAGKHTLLYTYRPVSFRIGMVISAAGLVVVGAFVAWAARRT